MHEGSTCNKQRLMDHIQMRLEDDFNIKLCFHNCPTFLIGVILHCVHRPRLRPPAGFKILLYLQQSTRLKQSGSDGAVFKV